jgi:hypothetical protein
MSEDEEVRQRPPPPVLKFPAGIDNRSREYALVGGAARSIENMDVTRDGGLVSRRGLRLAAVGGFHSPFVHPNRRYMLVVKDGVLQRMSAAEGFVALKPVGPSVCYALLNDEIYWTDGAEVGRVRADGEMALWGMPTPPLPMVSASASGGLHAGTYQIAMTAVHSSGLESGASDTVSVEVVEGGGIQVTAPSASGVSFAFYRTPPGAPSDELRQAAVLSPAASAVLGTALLGRPPETLRVSPPVPGQRMAHHKGRLWVASGSVVWFTDTKSPHWLRPDQGYYQFESAVRMLGSAEDGVYVGLYDRVYYLQGTDPYDMTQRSVSDVGAAAGDAVDIPYSLFAGDGPSARQVAWWDVEGFLVLGKPGGVVVRPTQSVYSAGSVGRGAMAYRTNAGLQQLVSVLAGNPRNELTAGDVLTSQVFGNGVVLNS